MRMTRALPSLESLRIFEACARHGNFSRAAAELGITPAAVSLRIRNLEADLGGSLFDRNGPHVAITRPGAELASRIGEMLELARSAVQACRDRPLRVTVTPTFARWWLAPRLASYQDVPGAAPIRLDVSADIRPPAEFDLAIRSGMGGWEGFDSVELLPILRTPMLSPSLARVHAVETPSDLMRLPLLPDPSWRDWFLLAGLDAVRPTFSTVVYASQDLEASAVCAGAGAGLLSPTLFASLVDGGQLVQPFDHVLQGPDAYHLLTRKGDDRRAVAHFTGWLNDQLRR